MCDQCRQLQAENAKLKARVVRLKKQLERIRITANHFAHEATQRQGKGNLPRVAWSYLKGVRAVAVAINELC